MANIRNRNWFARDADSLRAELVRNAKTNFRNEIVDFSPSSVGGMLLEMAAQVGDTFQFYLDYQFGESQWDTAVEIKNIQRFLRDVSIRPAGASPASLNLEITLVAPADPSFQGDRPNYSVLPVIKNGTRVRSFNGIEFVLAENVDFTESDPEGNPIAEIVDAIVGGTGEIESYILRRRGIAVSGNVKKMNFSVPATAPNFYTIALPERDVSEIISIIDSEGNRWYEVENLSQNTAFTRVKNNGPDQRSVPSLLKTIQTNKRFIREYNLQTGVTFIRFGAGSKEGDPDFEDVSVPFRNSSVVEINLDPGRIVNNLSLGDSPRGLNLEIYYRFGGGARHNIPENSISAVEEFIVDFPEGAPPRISSEILESILINNPERAKGGSAPLTVEDYRALIPTQRVAQGRIVDERDLIARVKSLPTEFGRIEKAAVRASLPGQPTRLWVVCRDNRLVTASMALKQNIKEYLTTLRLIGDSIDILDCPILNWSILCEVVVEEGWSKQAARADLTRSLINFATRTNFDPDQAIDIDRIRSRVLRVNGVEIISRLEIIPLIGIVGNYEYSNYVWRVPRQNGKIIPPPGGVFEMLVPSENIRVSIL